MPLKSSQYASNCDPKLPVLALDYRREHQLMTQNDFCAYNVSVWRLEKDGKPEYISGHNITAAELDEKHPKSGDDDISLGLHAEPLLAATIWKRRDVLRGETVVTQIFTERTPCSECHQFLQGIPYLQNVPRYFYLQYSDRQWQKQQADGKWGLFLMDCYRLR